MDKNFGKPRKMDTFVAVYWIRHLMRYGMKSRYLKRMAMYKVHLNPMLDRHLEGPQMQEKVDAGNALLARVGLPAEFVERF